MENNLKAALDQIRREINARPLTDFIRLTPNPKAGRNFFICPICGSGTGPDGTSGFMVYPDTNRAICRSRQCFGEKGQDTLGALEIIWKCTEREAMERAGYYARDYTDGKKAAPITPPAPPKQERKEEPEQDFTAFIVDAEKNIEQPAALEYLSFRGISLETARRLKFGFAPAWQHPKAIAEGKNPPTSPRLIIPTSRKSYLARDTRKEIPEAAQPYKKSKAGKVHTFNAAALYAADRKPCFIVEGEIDAASIEEVGGHACAIGSTSRTKAFLEELKAKPTDKMILLALDNDQAGQNATETLKKGLEELTIPCAVVNISMGHKDPNEALTADRAAFIAAVKEAEKKNDPATRRMVSFLKAVSGEGYRPMPTGLAQFDDIVGGGFIRQTLVMMGAAPGMGKSFFMQQVLESMAARGHSVLYFNLEMSETQMIARSLARIAHQRDGANMTALDILQGYKWTQPQREQIQSTAAYYTDTIGANMQYNPSGSTAQLDAIIEAVERAAEAAENTGREAPIICIDYLHLLRGKDREDAATTIKRAVDYFKNYAVTHNTISILILAFNRDSNKGGKVNQESGRDSSSIEYSADLMLGLNFRALETNSDPDQVEKKLEEARKAGDKQGYSLYRLKVLKSRLQGGIGHVDLKFYGKYGLFIPDKDKQSGMEIVDAPTMDRKWML